MHIPVLARRNVSIQSLSLILGALLLSCWSGQQIAKGEGLVYLSLLGGLLTVAAVMRWPSSPLVVFYPLSWIFWSYVISGIGQPEKLIGALGILGMLVMVLGKRERFPALPFLVTAGLCALLGAYLVSWLAHLWVPNALEYVISLVARVTFLYLAYFYLRTRDQLRWAVGLYIAAGIVAAVLTLAVSLMYGFGYARVTFQREMVERWLGPLWTSAVSSAQLGTAPALLLLGLYPMAHSRRQKVFVSALALFLFLMAFAAQYRRELLISVLVVLLFLLLDKYAGLRRPAITMLVISVALLFLALPRDATLQYRLQYETEQLLMGHSEEIRLVNLRAGLIAISQSPLLGHGPGSHALAIAPIVSPDRRFTASFNAFAGVGVEAGIFATVGLGLILFGTYVEARRGSRKVGGNSVEGWIVRCTPVLLLQIVLWFSFGNGIFLSQPWFLMGVSLAAVRLVRESSA